MSSLSERIALSNSNQLIIVEVTPAFLRALSPDKVSLPLEHARRFVVVTPEIGA